MSPGGRSLAERRAPRADVSRVGAQTPATDGHVILPLTRHRAVRRLRTRHPPHRRVIDLQDTYRQLARPWTHEQLAEHYRHAESHGESLIERRNALPARPIFWLATAVPPSATVSTAIHTLHALPTQLDRALSEQLLETTQRNTADAFHRCHRALELDAAEHGYKVEDWLPIVYDIAGPLLQSARLNKNPPSLVQVTQEAISWLSRTIAELDESSEQAPTSLAEALARLLAVWTFTDLALRHGQSG